MKLSQFERHPYATKMYYEYHSACLGPLFLIWFNFNPHGIVITCPEKCRRKLLFNSQFSLKHYAYNDIYLSTLLSWLHKLQRCNHWMDTCICPTLLYAITHPCWDWNETMLVKQVQGRWQPKQCTAIHMSNYVVPCSPVLYLSINLVLTLSFMEYKYEPFFQ